MWRRILREPLSHFLVLGALIFALNGWVAGPDAERARDRIVVDRARVDQLAAQFTRVWQREPTEEELRGLVEQWVREEIVYREGIAAGLDRGDPVVRRRVVQKMDFLTDGMAAAVPTEEELARWLDEYAGDYRIEARYGFDQRFFDPQGEPAAAFEARVADARAALERDPDADVGDRLLLPDRLADASESEIARAFGERFAGALAELPEDEWTGPVPSGYGAHLVRVTHREPARAARLEEVRRAVERDLLAARSAEAAEAFLEAARARYDVEIASDLGIELPATAPDDGSARGPANGSRARADVEAAAR